MVRPNKIEAGFDVIDKCSKFFNMGTPHNNVLAGSDLHADNVVPKPTRVRVCRTGVFLNALRDIPVKKENTGSVSNCESNLGDEKITTHHSRLLINNNSDHRQTISERKFSFKHNEPGSSKDHRNLRKQNSTPDSFGKCDRITHNHDIKRNNFHVPARVSDKNSSHSNHYWEQNASSINPSLSYRNSRHSKYEDSSFEHNCKDSILQKHSAIPSEEFSCNENAFETSTFLDSAENQIKSKDSVCSTVFTPCQTGDYSSLSSKKLSDDTSVLPDTVRTFFNKETKLFQRTINLTPSNNITEAKYPPHSFIEKNSSPLLIKEGAKIFQRTINNVPAGNTEETECSQSSLTEKVHFAAVVSKEKAETLQCTINNHVPAGNTEEGKYQQNKCIGKQSVVQVTRNDGTETLQRTVRFHIPAGNTEKAEYPQSNFSEKKDFAQVQDCDLSAGHSSLGEALDKSCEFYYTNEDFDDIDYLQDVPKPSHKQIVALTKVLDEVVLERASTDKHIAKKVFSQVNGVIMKYMQGCTCKLYGSYRAGFAIETSDFNIELCTLGHNVASRFLNELQKLLQKELPDYYVTYEDNQKVKNSKVTCIEPLHGICCNIKYLGNDHTEYKTSKLLEMIFQLDDRVKTLAIALRHWAEVCDIHEVEYGRLHPFGYMLIVIHFLQQHNPPVLPIVNIELSEIESFKENTQSTGELWIELFKYYSTVFNWRDHVVSILSKDPVVKDTKAWGQCWIGIEEPFNPKINVAKSVISQDVSHCIQMCFMRSYRYFSNPTSVSETEEGSGCSIDEGYASSEQNKEFNYTFSALNFTQGMDIPTFCSTCDELGFTCNECAEDEKQELDQLPKMTSAFLKNIDDALENASDAHCLTDNDIRERLNLVSKLERYMSYKFKGAKLQLIGSSMNGFGFKTSDLDICMTLENIPQESMDMKKTIRKLSQHMRRNKEFSHVIAVYSAKIPLVQFLHSETGLRGDISLYNELAVHNTRLLSTYSVIDRRAKILGCAMKLLAKNACIADTAQKSLSSYSYLLMVIHYLQRTKPPVLPVLQELYNKLEGMPEHKVDGWNIWFFDDLENLSNVWKEYGKNEMSLGELWVGLLKFYTELFDDQHVITIRQSDVLVKFQKESSSRLFNIEDPFIFKQNLGSVMSEQMSIKTFRTLLRARKIFGTPAMQVPVGFENFKDYFFHPMNLTDGRVMKAIECDLCGKLGHKSEKCVRFKLNRSQPFLRRGGYSYRRPRYQRTYGNFGQRRNNYFVQ